MGRAKSRGWGATSPLATPFEEQYLKHQREVFRCPARQVVYVKGRRAGGTHGMVVRLCELAHERRGSRHVWIDLTQRHVKRAVRRFFARVLRGRRWRYDAAAGVMRFPNGSVCDFGSAQRPELLEGFGYDFVWVNEAGHLLRNPSLFFESLLPMVLESPQAQLFLVGAPRGRGLFEQMYGWGQDADHPDWQSFRHTSFDNPKVDREWLRRVEQVMPERAWRQEILAEFEDDEGAVFHDVERCATAAEEAAPHPDAPYVLGVDFGRHRDWTVAWVGRADTGEAVACERFRHLPWEVQLARLAALSRRYGEAPLWLDATGVGDPLCDALEAEGLPVQRVTFTSRSKERLVNRLAIALERGSLRFLPHEPTLRELRAYRYELTAAGNVRTGGYREHDDCVMALALCCWGLAERGARDFILGAPMVTRELD